MIHSLQSGLQVKELGGRHPCECGLGLALASLPNPGGDVASDSVCRKLSARALGIGSPSPSLHISI
jgi:hypothetical protein